MLPDPHRPNIGGNPSTDPSHMSFLSELKRRNVYRVAVLYIIVGWVVLRYSVRYLDGEPMQVSCPRDKRYFDAAMQLLRHLHRAGITHNDLAKEPNVLVQTDGSPAFIDFQLASYRPHRDRLFRLLAREDIRHLLKHKRTYCPDELTRRERGILDSPSVPARIHRATIKPVYLFVTRRLLGWADREGAHDRGARR